MSSEQVRTYKLLFTPGLLRTERLLVPPVTAPLDGHLGLGGGGEGEVWG